jgi:hypothetical protein
VAGACDPSKQHIETDGWYVDLPDCAGDSGLGAADTACGERCVDQINATVNGDPRSSDSR